MTLQMLTMGQSKSAAWVNWTLAPTVYLLDLSLRDPQAYAKVGRLLESLPVKGSLALFAWALAHHALASVRHLLMDIDAGSSLAVARRSAWVVNVAGLAVAVVSLRILL